MVCVQVTVAYAVLHSLAIDVTSLRYVAMENRFSTELPRKFSWKARCRKASLSVSSGKASIVGAEESISQAAGPGDLEC